MAEAATVTEEERAKFTAEAEAAHALAIKHKSEAAMADAQCVKLEHEIAMVAIDRAIKERNERESLAQNRHHHVYAFNESVGAASVKSCIDQLTQWMRLPNGTGPTPMEIIFNSPGGEVVNGMALFDFIQVVRAAGHHVTTSSMGMAASMAGVLLQAGDLRIMGRQSYVLIHEIAYGAVGKIGEIEDTTKFAHMMQERILDIFAMRAKVTKPFIKRHWARTDWWLSSDDCIKYGFVDQVR